MWMKAVLVQIVLLRIHRKNYPHYLLITPYKPRISGRYNFQIMAYVWITAQCGIAVMVIGSLLLAFSKGVTAVMLPSSHNVALLAGIITGIRSW